MSDWVTTGLRRVALSFRFGGVVGGDVTMLEIDFSAPDWFMWFVAAWATGWLVLTAYRLRLAWKQHHLSNILEKAEKLRRDAEP